MKSSLFYLISFIALSSEISFAYDSPYKNRFRETVQVLEFRSYIEYNTETRGSDVALSNLIVVADLKKGLTASLQLNTPVTYQLSSGQLVRLNGESLGRVSRIGSNEICSQQRCTFEVKVNLDPNFNLIVTASGDKAKPYNYDGEWTCRQVRTYSGQLLQHDFVEPLALSVNRETVSYGHGKSRQEACK